MEQYDTRIDEEEHRYDSKVMDQDDRTATQLWMQLVNTWKRSFRAAVVIELPLFFALLLSTSKGISGLASALVWLHVIPLTVVSFIFLRIFGHGEPPVGSTTVWHLGYWGFVFVLQAALTMLIVVVLLKFLGRKQSGATSG